MRAIHELITSDFNPLELCTKLAPLFQRLAEISTPLSPAAPIKDVALASYTTSLKQVGTLSMRVLLWKMRRRRTGHNGIHLNDLPSQGEAA